MGFRMVALLFIFTILSFGASAVQPDEVLDDPVLEARARALSSELRCVVCQGETIDASDASLAREFRLILREQLMEGKTDEEILEFMRLRYGDYVLMKPRFQGSGAIVWLFGPLVFLIGLFLTLSFIRRSGKIDEDL